MSVRMMAGTLNIPKTTGHDIVSNKLHMRKVCTRLVPKLLTDDHKNNRMTIATKLLKRVQNKPDFSDHGLATVLRPPYNPNLSPADFFLISRIKTTLKGVRFEKIEAIQTL